MEKSIILKNVRVHFVTKKENQYNDEIYYFKVFKKDHKILSNISKSENCKLPWFNSQDRDMLLKAKTKYVEVIDFNRDDVYTCNIELKSYSLKIDSGEIIIGYYVSKISGFQPKILEN